MRSEPFIPSPSMLGFSSREFESAEAESSNRGRGLTDENCALSTRLPPGSRPPRSLAPPPCLYGPRPPEPCRRCLNGLAPPPPPPLPDLPLDPLARFPSGVRWTEFVVDKEPKRSSSIRACPASCQLMPFPGRKDLMRGVWWMATGHGVHLAQDSWHRMGHTAPGRHTQRPRKGGQQVPRAQGDIHIYKTIIDPYTIHDET